jgi:hypothetical protein
VELLRQRTEEERARLAARIGHLEIRKHSCDFESVRVLDRANTKMFADRILIGEEVFGESLIDYDNLLRRSSVLRGKIAATHDWYADGLEKVGAGTVPGREARVVRARRRMALGDNAGAPHVAAEGNIPDQADVGHSRQRCKSIFDFTIERRETIDGITHALGIKGHHVAVRSSDAEILVLQVAERFGHEQCARQQDHR